MSAVMNPQFKQFLKIQHDILVGKIMNPELKKIVKEQTYFAGGCIRSMVNGHLIKDYDMYFYDQEAVEDFVALAEKERYAFKKTAIGNFDTIDGKFQLITVIAGDPEEVTGSFDFTINECYYCPQNDEYKLPYEGKELILCEGGTHSPLNALIRINKFLKMGYYVPDSTLVQLGVRLTKMKPIRSEEQLEKHLQGVSADVNMDELFDDDNTPDLPRRPIQTSSTRINNGDIRINRDRVVVTNNTPQSISISSDTIRQWQEYTPTVRFETRAEDTRVMNYIGVSVDQVRQDDDGEGYI